MKQAIFAELIDSEYRVAKEFFSITAAELGWHYLRKEFALYGKAEMSRNMLCERIMVLLFTHKHGLSMSRLQHERRPHGKR